MPIDFDNPNYLPEDFVDDAGPRKPLSPEMRGIVRRNKMLVEARKFGILFSASMSEIQLRGLINARRRGFEHRNIAMHLGVDPKQFTHRALIETFRLHVRSLIGGGMLFCEFPLERPRTMHECQQAFEAWQRAQIREQQEKSGS